MASPADFSTDVEGSDSQDLSDSTRVRELTEEIQQLRLELAQARREQEKAVEKEAGLRRKRGKSQQEAEALASGLQVVLHERTKLLARTRWRHVGSDRVSRSEWEQVKMLRESRLFKPGWYLRQNLDVARAGVDPALHFLRAGAREDRDPGPKFDVSAYLEAHPEVRESGVNPLIHHLQQNAEASKGRVVNQA